MCVPAIKSKLGSETQSMVRVKVTFSASQPTPEWVIFTEVKSVISTIGAPELTTKVQFNTALAGYSFTKVKSA